MNGSPENISRREFLKAAAVGGLLLSEFVLPASARAALEKLLNSQEYYNETLEELLTRLELAVYESDTEVMWAWVERGGKSYAMNILHKATDRTAHGVNLTPLHEDRAVEKAYLLHTHPAALFLVDPKFPRAKAEQIVRERESRYARIPSSGDIMEMVADRVRLNEMNLKREIKHFVVEPSGVWSYDADLAHPFFKDIFSGTPEGDTQAEMARGNWSLGMTLQGALEDWQERLNGEKGMSEETRKEFIAVFAKEYGVTFSYTPRAAT
ncbi:MAG: hypothetical protein A3C93_06495 [Candidatus Lloydbacteria bacterium RIFCSPHIGHO2_02_FULL_54_17]|uniref:Twin-arginine translocation signal domain-containing protein n=1 Tax=Candidatus Lloydbacteria bacterium RIFCSPHIGHO2_02_FULL_54_17 TaxID=1798664 RepID=A0A1G2DDX9_9BACT|nr:MAG: hypothetical protein A2762_05270 [Candidatus Lloydbacteria bacterium RIFCSPHIGHO2_01_FULL_54_11]OGZ11151.1 MAG: hypothetical protein A3C93_06495 [Candidatus Lloydbacteria bacterium RIFCSPHIGHO2_02_FULL_54_17]OGZ14994.1 MAG: hypothetical protein A2948_00925 [Candidatus Lloydbacteria bacterium RIFCSPLOWO2_01_FULL_54_18]OGZ15255.1 MAG: hypothetical protein A3H76_03165 [Candidatus Lloydbacteria bacterium RIFCSPLOWO2_02_FULL_54_12]